MATQSCLQATSDKDHTASPPVHGKDAPEDLSGEASSPAPWIPVHHRGQFSGAHHPLYRQLSIKSGQVNSLTLDKVKEILNQLGLCTR